MILFGVWMFLCAHCVHNQSIVHSLTMAHAAAAAAHHHSPLSFFFYERVYDHWLSHCDDDGIELCCVHVHFWDSCVRTSACVCIRAYIFWMNFHILSSLIYFILSDYGFQFISSFFSSQFISSCLPFSSILSSDCCKMYACMCVYVAMAIDRNSTEIEKKQ